MGAPLDLAPLFQRLGADLIERDAVLRVAVVGALAGENVLLLGPPGTGKSLLARRVAGLFADAQYFQYLLTRFTTPDEIFGPVSLRELQLHDAYARKTDGYLPTANVAFIDEIFKASSAILNSLLTLLNERLYFNGAQVVHVPLVVLLAAANEVPAEEELTAFYDRFPVRLQVLPITEPEGLLSLLRPGRGVGDAALPEELRLPVGIVARVREGALGVTLSPVAERVLVRLKRELDALSEASPEDPWRWYVSDRRWRHAVQVLRAAAWLDGRSSVSPVDCALLRHCLWNRPADADTVVEKLDLALEEAGTSADPRMSEVANPWMRLLTELRDTPKVGRPIYNGFVWSHGTHRQVMTDLRAAAALQNTWESVRSTGFFFDARAGVVRRVKTRADGSLLFNVGYGMQPVGDAPTWQGHLRGGLLPQFEDGAVTVERKVSPGMVIDGRAADPADAARWIAELDRLIALVALREAARSAEASELSRATRGHPFVPLVHVQALLAGHVRLGLVLKEWASKLQGLRRALVEGGEYETADVDAGQPISPEAALRELASAHAGG